MNNTIQIIMAFLGSLGFALVFNMQKEKLLKACFGGLIAWVTYLAIYSMQRNMYISCFIAASIAALYSEIMAKLNKSPVTIFNMIATIPLIPGASLYRSMDNLVQGELSLAFSEGIQTLGIAASMSTGIIIISMIFSLLRFRNNRKFSFFK